MFRRSDSEVEVFLVHPGGPFWAKKDAGAWSIPKGEYAENEDPLEAAKREFQEETGFRPQGRFIGLSEVKQPGGKAISGWAFEGDCDPTKLKSNTFVTEWPPRSGHRIEAPEIDRGAWFPVEEARARLLIGQRPFLDRLLERLRQLT
jgi:predicted NUDIX family NTP pyrophosphohydrolase